MHKIRDQTSSISTRVPNILPKSIILPTSTLQAAQILLPISARRVWFELFSLYLWIWVVDSPLPFALCCHQLHVKHHHCSRVVAFYMHFAQMTKQGSRHWRMRPMEFVSLPHPGIGCHSPYALGLIILLLTPVWLHWLQYRWSNFTLVRERGQNWSQWL